MVEPTVVPENKRLVVAICYVIPLLGGIVLFLIAEGNRTLKFHAFQAIVLGFIVWIAWTRLRICLPGLLGLCRLVLLPVRGLHGIYTEATGVRLPRTSSMTA